jgi:hypothetical protein
MLLCALHGAGIRLETVQSVSLSRESFRTLPLSSVPNLQHLEAHIWGHTGWLAQLARRPLQSLILQTPWRSAAAELGELWPRLSRPALARVIHLFHPRGGGRHARPSGFRLTFRFDENERAQLHISWHSGARTADLRALIAMFDRLPKTAFARVLLDEPPSAPPKLWRQLASAIGIKTRFDRDRSPACPAKPSCRR